MANIWDLLATREANDLGYTAYAKKQSNMYQEMEEQRCAVRKELEEKGILDPVVGDNFQSLLSSIEKLRAADEDMIGKAMLPKSVV